MCFIWSITHTTAAITLLMLAAMPFMTAILGYIFLKEKVSNTTLTAIIVAAIGIVFMAFNSREIGTLFGLLVGLLSALGFSFFSVSLSNLLINITYLFINVKQKEDFPLFYQ